MYIRDKPVSNGSYSVSMVRLSFLINFNRDELKRKVDLSDSMKRKAIEYLAQKSTKQIRTELVKMTSEASLLPKGLKSIQ